MVLPSYGSAIPTLLKINPHESGQKQFGIHNRWHPDIPCIGSITLNQPFKVECIDYSGGQVCNDDHADDVLDLDHDTDHHMSGPFHVSGAEPGDILEIDILDVQPFESQPWGYSVTAPHLGSLDHPDHPTLVTKTIWDFHGVSTSSRHVPHVSFHGRPHPGVIGTAPSKEMLETWNKREGALAAEQVREKGETALSLPLRKGAYVGQDLDEGLRERIHAEGARTAPGRENGGNIDIASLTIGTKMYLPVYVPGANLSVGDLHFAEGDGEPTTAIEMSGIVTLRVSILPRSNPFLPSSSTYSGSSLSASPPPPPPPPPPHSLPAPVFTTSPSEPLYPRRLVFIGLSTTPTGAQTDNGGMQSYRHAAWQAIDYLVKWGWTREQAYVILSCAPIETKVVATANKPNFVVSLGLPLEAFGFDISPRAWKGRVEMAGPAVVSAERTERETRGVTADGTH